MNTNVTVISALQQKAATRHLISGEDGQTKNITGVDANLVFIRTCKNSTFTLGKCIKLIVERCSNINIILPTTLITGCLEIIKCEGITITSHTVLPTIQIDNTDGVRLVLDNYGQICNIVHCQSKNISVIVSTQNDLLPTMQDVKPNQYMPYDSQIISRYTEGKFVSELLVREGNSGFATESEHNRNLEQDRINREIAAAHFNQTKTD